MFSDLDVSRKDTTRQKAMVLAQLSLDAQLGKRGWVHRAMKVYVAESRKERHLAADIVRHRHYLANWPVPPKKLFLSYLANLGGAEAAGMAMVALLPAQYHVTAALGLQKYEVLTLVRMWRADDLGPRVAPDFTPELLRRVVRGERTRGPLRGVREEWILRKCREDGLRAAPRLLATYADPAVGHDGMTYLSAGARFCGRGTGGKLLFAWGLDEEMQRLLTELEREVTERSEKRGP